MALLLIVKALSLWHIVPSPESALAFLANMLGRQNYAFLACATIIENTVIVNTYFPGAFVILFSMASTHGNVRLALATYAVIFVSAFSAHHVNYWAGRSMARRSEPRAMLVPPSLSEPLWKDAVGGLAYFHPQLGSLYSFQVGTARVGYWQFSRRLALGWGFWSIFWGITMYEIGRVPVSGGAFVWILYVYLVAWGIRDLMRARS